MQRREFFAWCLSGCVTGGWLLSPDCAPAQDQPARVKLHPENGGAANETKRPRPDPGSIAVQLPEELEDLLRDWEKKSAQIKRMEGKFERFVYDNVFLVQKCATGDFWYAFPDKGRMDFKPRPIEDANAKVSRGGGPDGEPVQFTAQSDSQQKWVCTGNEIFIINEEQKLFDRVEIPPHLQGTNVVNGPLPFLFGMKAEQAKDRYFLSLGDKHNPDGRIGGRRQLHIVAAPRKEMDAKEWRRAEVILEPTHFVPTAIRLIDPTGNRETVYTFYGLKLNPNWLPIFNPFNERPPRGFVGMNARAPAEEEGKENSPIVPAGGRQPAAPAGGGKSKR